MLYGSGIMLCGFRGTFCGFGIKLRYVVLELNYIMWF